MAGTTHNKRAADAEPRANAAYVSPLKRIRAAVARMQNRRSIERIDELKQFIRNNKMMDAAVMSSITLRLRVVWTSFDMYKGEPVARIHLTDGCSDDTLEELHMTMKQDYKKNKGIVDEELVTCSVYGVDKTNDTDLPPDGVVVCVRNFHALRVWNGCQCQFTTNLESLNIQS